MNRDKGSLQARIYFQDSRWVIWEGGSHAHARSVKNSLGRGMTFRVDFFHILTKAQPKTIQLLPGQNRVVAYTDSQLL